MLTVTNEISFNTFKPAWWCPGAHIQTIYGGLFYFAPKIKYQRRRFELQDGDFLNLDFNFDYYKDKNKPLLLILHGLEGSSDSPYVRSLAHLAYQDGWNYLVINQRTCGGEMNRLPYSYHSGRTEDLDEVLTMLKEEGYDNIYLVGYSIGGNQALKWMGEKKEAATWILRKSVAVSVPFDFKKCVERLDRGINRQTYGRNLLCSMKAKMRAKDKQFPEIIQYKRIKNCRTIQEFDREMTARIYGFQDEYDYWQKASCSTYLEAIRVRSLLIQANDDPFFTGDLIPFEKIKKSKYLRLLLTAYGGHIGFIAGPWPWQQEFWLENQILKFLKS